MTSYDAWTVRRLLCGKPVSPDETERVSARFRPIAHRLGGLPIDRRRDAYDAFLDGRDDRVAIAREVIEADPEEPAPEPDLVEDGDHEEDGWEPIRYSTLPAVEPFPLDVLPPPARQLAEVAARSIGSPVDFVAVGILAAASIAIGKSCSLMVKQGYFASASVYAAVVGNASSGKSPSLDAAIAPISAIQERLYIERKAEVERWETEPPEGRRSKPALRRLMTSNTTTEALASTLAANQRGLIVTPDEMVGWVSSMDQYKGGRGGDRPFYLSAWSGALICIDRAKNAQEPVVVPHPFLSVVGGMVPSMLPSLARGGTSEDGFTARLLFTYPDRGQRTDCDEGIPDDVREDYAALLERLHARPLLEVDGKLAAHIVRITPAARQMRKEWRRSHHEEVDSPHFLPNLDGAWGKLEAYGYRLALILHMLDLASDPTTAIEGNLPDLSVATLDGAFRLVSYFKSHARRVYSAIDGKSTNGGGDVQALLGWIVRNGHRQFSIRDVKSDFDRFKDDEAALLDALDWMIARNLIRPQPQPAAGVKKPGRKPSARFESNPDLWKSPRFRRFLQNPMNDHQSEGFEGFGGELEDES